MDEVDCCIVGGGPAGMVLGLLLARAGVEVVVLEKHADFLRDFRGDTVHPSTLGVLDRLGLADRFLALPHQEVARVGVTTDDGTYAVADFSRLPGRFPFMTFVPQWHFLNFLAGEAEKYRCFRLRLNAEAVGLLHRDGAVSGVRYRDADGTEQQVQAPLTVAADGRNSVVRELARLVPREFTAPMDVLWFRLPKLPGDDPPPFGGLGRLTRNRLLVLIDRGDYWQSGYVVAKDGYHTLRQAGVAAFRDDLATMLPGMPAALATLRAWDDVSVLSVRVNRLRRWHRPGLLLIGDAAHAMSPIGGVGINLAVQDAVAAARLLTGPLRRGTPTSAELARVQRRRWLATALIQLVQRQLQQRFLFHVLAGDRPRDTPRILRLLQRVPALQGLPARVIGLGVLPERVPPAVRETGAPARDGTGA